MPIMQYVRARRLSEAARRLAGGSPDILTVALDAGYNSHEAFTRAFRDLFNVTPETIRRRGSVEELVLIEAHTMNTAPTTTLGEPSIDTKPAMLIVGLSEHYSCEQGSGGIPSQWQRFVNSIGRIPQQKSSDTFGIVYNTDDAGNMDYLSGVEVREFGEVPQGFVALRLPARKYAIFFHPHHISTIRSSWNYVWNAWLPRSQFQLADAPVLEHYDARFDPQTGAGGVELWVPLQ
jgi:AraC family transcriptional regulator